MAEAGALIAVQAGVVGPAVGDDVAHAGSRCAIVARVSRSGGDDAGDAAHG